MLDLIQAAALSDAAGRATRQEAERAIIALREQNPTEFVRQVSEVLINPEIPEHPRQAAGTILAISLKHINSNNNYVWDFLEANNKAILKNSILGVLVSESKVVRRSAANVVASICSIQLPKNEWEGIIEKICINIRHENPIVKEASILTLGFICENMKDKTSYCFSLQQQESIMAAIMLGLQQQDSILIETSIQALLNSIGSFRQILQKQQPREYILNQIVSIINSGTHLIQGLHILGEFVKSAYQSLGPYMQNLYLLLGPIITKNSEEYADSCVAAMQVIENIAEYYRDEKDDKDLANYITGGVGINIVTLLLQNLVAIDASNNLDDNLVTQSTAKALQTIFEGCGSQEFKDLVLNFVQTCMSESGWKFQQASIKAFSLLLIGLPVQQNQQLISTSFNQLIQLLNHQSPHVQNATFDSLLIITEICGNLILRSDNFVNYLFLITSKMSNEKFICKGCRVVDQLCAAQKALRLGKFNKIADDLIQFFLNMCTNTEASLLIGDYCVATIMSIIEVIDNDEVCLKYLTYSVSNFQQINNVADSQKRGQFYSFFFTIMQYTLHNLRKNKNMDVNLLTTIYNKTVGYFQAINDVTSDGLYAIECLVPYFGKDFRIVEDFWKYLMHSLNKWQDLSLFKAGLSCISFVATTFGSQLGSKLPDFVPNLLHLIRDPIFDRQAKIHILIFLGQIFLNCNGQAIPYLEEFMKVLMICCEAAINLHSSDSNYSQNLKQTVIESIKCVIHGMSEIASTSKIMDNFTLHIFKFVQITCQKQQNPTVKYLNHSFLLLADYAKFFPNLALPYKKQAFISEGLDLIKKFQKNQEQKESIRYIKTYLD